MPRGGANFSSEELVRVLSHYDIGVVHRVKPLTGGNRRAPKVIVTADKGIFLLKRRPRGGDDLGHIALAHAVQQHLASCSFPVASLLATTDERTTALSLDSHLYEFFQYVSGARYDGSAEATREAGRQLAWFHKHLADFGAPGVEDAGTAEAASRAGESVASSDRGQDTRDTAAGDLSPSNRGQAGLEPSRHETLDPRAASWCFHDSAMVRRHLGLIASWRGRGDLKLEGTRLGLLPPLARKGTEPGRSSTGRSRKEELDALRAVAQELLLRYDKSSARVNELRFASWKRQIVHGDWHPGNLLFSDRRIVAVVDFDSIRVAPPATDLANGMLQFSIVGDRPNPADWPAHFDRGRVLEFLAGYREVIRLSERKRYGLVDLMIESMIAEAVLPVAATGSFGQHSGLDFLQMILRKTQWLRRHRRELREAMLQ